MNYEITPRKDSFRKGRSLVNEALSICKAVRTKEKSLEVNLGGTSDEKIIKHLNGVSGRAFNEETVEITFSNNSKQWKNEIKAVTGYCYGMSVFYEEMNFEEINYRWQRVLIIGFSQLFSENLFNNCKHNLNTYHSKEKIFSEYDVEELLKTAEPNGFDPFLFGGENFDSWTGFSASYYIAKELVKNDIDDLLKSKKTDVLDAVKEVEKK